MIRCKFYLKSGYYESFEISGHAGYSKKGTDIVCAAVSTVTQHTARVLKENGAKIKFEDGFLRVENIQKDTISQKFTEELFKTLEDLREQYSKHIKLEVSENEN